MSLCSHISGGGCGNAADTWQAGFPFPSHPLTFPASLPKAAQGILTSLLMVFIDPLVREGFFERRAGIPAQHRQTSQKPSRSRSIGAVATLNVSQPIYLWPASFQVMFESSETWQRWSEVGQELPPQLGVCTAICVPPQVTKCPNNGSVCKVNSLTWSKKLVLWMKLGQNLTQKF